MIAETQLGTYCRNAANLCILPYALTQNGSGLWRTPAGRTGYVGELSDRASTHFVFQLSVLVVVILYLLNYNIYFEVCLVDSLEAYTLVETSSSCFISYFNFSSESTLCEQAKNH